MLDEAKQSFKDSSDDIYCLPIDAITTKKSEERYIIYYEAKFDIKILFCVVLSKFFIKKTYEFKILKKTFLKNIKNIVCTKL